MRVKDFNEGEIKQKAKPNKALLAVDIILICIAIGMLVGSFLIDSGNTNAATLQKILYILSGVMAGLWIVCTLLLIVAKRKTQATSITYDTQNYSTTSYKNNRAKFSDDFEPDPFNTSATNKAHNFDSNNPFSEMAFKQMMPSGDNADKHSQSFSVPEMQDTNKNN